MYVCMYVYMYLFSHTFTQEKSQCEQCAKKDSLYWKQLKPPWKSFFLLGHELDQCAPSRVFPIETGATIDTSWDQ